MKNKLSKLCKEFCKENFNIKLVFNSFKIKHLLTLKEFWKENFNIKLVVNSFKFKHYSSNQDPIPKDLKSFRVYKFTCGSGSSNYIGETCRLFKTWLRNI